MNNGDLVKDIISGYEGVVVGVAEYVTGCKQLLVSPRATKDDGSRIDSEWLDEIRLELMQAGVFIPNAGVVAKQPGGPQTHQAPKD